MFKSAIAAPLGCATTGAVACSNLAIFIVTLICNGIAGSKNKAVSDAHPTAFTPAGYAFAIWGVIYALGTCCVLFLAAPTKWKWAVDHVGPFLAINLAANAMWIFAFTSEWAGLWLSVALIFCGLLVPLVVLHRRLSIGSDMRPVTVTEFMCVHLFISLYLGWTCVACIANVAVAATPTGGPAPEPLGWSPSTWSIIMQTVAATLAIVMLALHRDFVFAAPIAWALFAIAKQQESETWPGDSNVTLCARALGAIVAVAAAFTWIMRIVRWRSGKTHFAPMTLLLPCTKRPVVLPSLGLIAAASPAGMRRVGDESAAYLTLDTAADHTGNR